MHIQQYNDYIACDYARLDRYISEHLQLLSRSQIKSVTIDALTVNGKKAKWSQKVRVGDHLMLTWQAPESFSLLPQDISLDILYEDEHVWVINKAQGMVVHPGAGRKRDTLANALAYRLQQSQGEIYDEQRLGIVHRLDMETSGVIICAKDAKTHAFLAQQFKDRTVKKRYMAILATPHLTPARGLIHNYLDRSRRVRTHFVCGDNPERGRLAVTGYRLLANFNALSLVLFKPYTGRTHQLRVHAKSELFPIVGDPIYYREDPREASLMLHAWKLQILLPNENEPRTFMAPIPDRFYRCLALHKREKIADSKE